MPSSKNSREISEAERERAIRRHLRDKALQASLPQREALPSAEPGPDQWLENWNGGATISERLARAMRRQLEREGWYQNPPPINRRKV